MRRTGRLVFLSSCLVAVLIALNACAQPAAPAATPTRPPLSQLTPTPVVEKPLEPSVKVKFGGLLTLSQAALFVAQEKGYFKEQGLDVEIIVFPSAPDLLPALATGDLDVGFSAPNAGLYNAVARGLPTSIVAGMTKTSPGLYYQALVVRKDLSDSGQIKDYRDLKGRAIGVTGYKGGGTNEIAIDGVLRSVGLTYDDVRLENLSFPDINLAMAGKKLDVAIQNEPHVALGVEQGIFVVWKNFDELVPPEHQDSVMMYSSRFAERSPEAAKRFMVAYLKGARDYNDAFYRNKDRATVVQIAAKALSIKDLSLFDKMKPTTLDPNGYLNEKSLAEDLDWNVRKGYVKDKPDLAKVIDTSFVANALNKLGVYK